MKTALLVLAVLPVVPVALALRAWLPHWRMRRAMARLAALPDKGVSAYGVTPAPTGPSRCPNCGASIIGRPVGDDVEYRCAGKPMPASAVIPVPLPPLDGLDDIAAYNAIADAVRVVAGEMPDSGAVPRRFRGELRDDVCALVLSFPPDRREVMLGRIVAHAKETGAMSLERARWAVDGILSPPCAFVGRGSAWGKVWR